MKLSTRILAIGIAALLPLSAPRWRRTSRSAPSSSRCRTRRATRWSRVPPSSPSSSPPRAAARSRSTSFPGGTLGGDAANVSALQGGTIEFVMLNSGILASQVKDFEVFDFPFMFASAKEADAIVDGPFGEKLEAKLQEKSIVGLAYFELGFRQLTNSKRAVNTVDDIAGLKLRVIPNADQRRLGQGAGREPDADGLPRALRGAGAEGHRRPGEPADRDPGEQVLRGAEVPDADQPPVQPAVADLQQEGLGHAVAGREEDPRGRPRSRPRSSSARSTATPPPASWTR